MKRRYYSEKQLDKITSLSRVTRWRMRRAGTFPLPVSISTGRIAYLSSDIDAWILGHQSQTADSDMYYHRH